VKNWKTYEEVARQVLTDIRGKFGIARVEGDQKLTGKSGTTWNVEGKAVRDDPETFLIIECKRYGSGGVKQEQVGGLAYRIKDSGASGGFIVTTMPLQRGAKRVADYEGIVTITIDPASTTEEYVASFLNEIRFTLVERPQIHESFVIRSIDAATGKVISEWKDGDPI